mmetsp:Transcript_7470/g.11166  ORF Transcript_7470/g.11166 Transcript_7470/m.11166 type:complete len:326 (+) Transcript_7470:77-1054(+)
MNTISLFFLLVLLIPPSLSLPSNTNSESITDAVVPKHKAKTNSDNILEGLKNGLSSGLASGFVKTLLQPFDTIKTVQQFSGQKLGLLDAGRVVVKRSGLGGLYSGLGITLVGSMPSVAIYFGMYQYSRRTLREKTKLSQPLCVALSAGFGNFIASFFRVPYEIIKQRLQAGMYPTTAVAIRSMYESGGIGSFFGSQSIAVQLSRDIPYAIVTLMTYEYLQSLIAKKNKGKEDPSKMSHFETLVVGAIAGGLGTLATNPMDVVKTRMMTSPEVYRGMWNTAELTLKKDGAGAFMRGSTPRLMHKIPANGLFFVSYEVFRAVLNVER